MGRRGRREAGATTGTGPRPGEAADDDENGRGLLIVDYLATRWGHFGVSGGPVTAWAELDDPPGGEHGEGPTGEGGPGDGGLGEPGSGGSCAPT